MRIVLTGSEARFREIGSRIADSSSLHIDFAEDSGGIGLKSYADFMECRNHRLRNLGELGAFELANFAHDSAAAMESERSVRSSAWQ